MLNYQQIRLFAYINIFTLFTYFITNYKKISNLKQKLNLLFSTLFSLNMNSARRLYGKKSLFVQSPPKQSSSFFLSKVQRKVNLQPNNPLGPGQYEISLPMVKPNFETIVKNDNTLIVKFNSNKSSAFHSKSPRFQYGGEEGKLQERRHVPKFSTLLPGNIRENEEDQVHEGKYLEQNLTRSLMISDYHKNYTKEQKQKQVSKQPKLIKNLSHRKSSKSSIQHSPQTKQKPHQTQIPQPHHHHTLPLTSRLHHLQPTILQSKKLHSNRYNSSQKSTQWSKYKLQRRSFVDEMGKEYQNIPGPGSYRVKEPKFVGYNDLFDGNSWQFSSRTVRNTFNLRGKGEGGLGNVALRYDGGERLMEDDEVKRRILSKKVSKSRLGGLKSQTSTILNVTQLPQQFTLEFASIHSRQNLFAQS